MRSKSLRILLFVLTFIFVVTMPWWLSTLVLIGLTIYFPFYLEVLFFAFLFDTLYAPHRNFPISALTVATAFLLVVMFIRTRVRT